MDASCYKSDWSCDRPMKAHHLLLRPSVVVLVDHNRYCKLHRNEHKSRHQRRMGHCKVKNRDWTKKFKDSNANLPKPEKVPRLDSTT